MIIDIGHLHKMDIELIQQFLWSVNIKQADLDYSEENHRYWSFAQDGYRTNSVISSLSEYQTSQFAIHSRRA